MTPEESIAWKPEWPGGSTDILPFYDTLCPPIGGVVVEIGCFFGRSIGFLALRRPDCHLIAIDMWQNEWDDAGERLPVGPDRERRDKYGGMFEAFRATLQEHAPGVFERLDIRRGRSDERLPEIPDASVDVCFIDGDHTRSGVRYDIQQAKRIVRPGGIIAGHDFHVQHWGGPVTLGVQDEFGDDYRLMPWPLEREGWEPGRSSVWVHYVPEAEVWRHVCGACLAGRDGKIVIPAGGTMVCEACGEGFEPGGHFVVTSAQFAQTAPRIARGGTFVQVEPERPIDASELAALLPKPEEPASP